MFDVLFAYDGWQNANYVLNEVRDPVRTLKIAGLLGLGITATLYIFANIAYFAYVPPYTLQKETLCVNVIRTAHLRRQPFWSLVQRLLRYSSRTCLACKRREQ